ncbi:lysozyme inhibitor LprI family protein [Methylocella tundrae]|uniref:Lysozyme inhibitor LprI N-terminal domain-containing protein n=1 Tax=Methylocella tundrae TaxID=227605 RepID=A0A4U8YZW5_METTU|nr:hypothetical protein [Methylocella tundrae]WPP04716.1 hypothetical protein SIN04_02460 [Methylocella tundrae]VFU06912.1 conserved protein of unknown function [Methylocella tundrae]
MLEFHLLLEALMPAIRLVFVSAWLIGGSLTASAQVASFDCAKAATSTEVAICREPLLGAKDIKMAAYYQILVSVEPAWSGMAYREFRDNQHDLQANWVTQARNACEGDVACLELAYDRRIDELTSTIAKSLGLTYGRMCDGG